MKPGGPLRRTPMVRRTPLVAVSFLGRKTVGKRARPTGPPRDVVDAVYLRAAYACELDYAEVGPTRGVDHHLHHRRPRRAGGSTSADINTCPNVTLLCPRCHDVVESLRTEAYNAGWLLHDRQDPAMVPLLIGADRLLYLTVDGAYSTTPPGSSSRFEDVGT